MDRTQISPKFEHSELWTKVSSQIFLNSSNYSFLPFSRLIWIFFNVLAAQTSASQAGSKFKTISQRVWKNNSRDFKKIWLLYSKGLPHFRPKPKTSQVLKDWTQTWRGSTQLYLLKKAKKPYIITNNVSKIELLISCQVFFKFTTWSIIILFFSFSDFTIVIHSIRCLFDSKKTTKESRAYCILWGVCVCLFFLCFFSFSGLYLLQFSVGEDAHHERSIFMPDYCFCCILR